MISLHIYDKEFVQRELPMTKQEVRAVTIAKLQLKPNSVLIDVGAGTGTIGIEAATYLGNGKVIGIEKEEKPKISHSTFDRKINPIYFVPFAQ